MKIHNSVSIAILPDGSPTNHHRLKKKNDKPKSQLIPYPQVDHPRATMITHHLNQTWSYHQEPKFIGVIGLGVIEGFRLSSSEVTIECTQNAASSVNLQSGEVVVVGKRQKVQQKSNSVVGGVCFKLMDVTCFLRWRAVIVCLYYMLFYDKVEKGLAHNYGVTCEDEDERRNSGAKTKTFKENYYLLPYAVSSKEDTAYPRQLITRIRVMINSLCGVSLFINMPYAQLVISQRYEVNVIDDN
ncbi:hypothetical protein Tco_1039497 [Tanacetum coccineum]